MMASSCPDGKGDLRKPTFVVEMRRLVLGTSNNGEKEILVDMETLQPDLRKVNERSVYPLLSAALREILSLLLTNDGSGKETNEKVLLDRLNVIQEYVWEQLNTGHWKSVPRVWRKVYSYVAFCKAVIIMIKGTESISEAIKSCDMGLLMGEPILGNLLSKLAFSLHKQMQGEEETVVTNLFHEPRMAMRNDEFSNPDTILRNQFPDNKFSIEHVDNPSLETFVQHHFAPKRPLILENIISHWPAVRSWSVGFIRSRCGGRTVPVEVGSKYTEDDWSQKLMTVTEFIDTYITSQSANAEYEIKKGYLAQHQLFHQIPELMDDIRIPEYCYVGSEDDIEINAWFGPGGTVSPVHYDPKHNLLAQIFGTKIIRVFPPSEWTLLYPHEDSSLLFNTSEADIEDERLAQLYPDVAKAKYCDVILSPGQVLYMPPKWAHFVKSLSPSFSVSFWFE